MNFKIQVIDQDGDEHVVEVVNMFEVTAYLRHFLGVMGEKDGSTISMTVTNIVAKDAK